jgi:hemolysin III
VSAVELTGSEPVKPRLRGVFHEVGFFLALISGAVLVLIASGTRAKIACGVYGISLAAMLGTSALYHRVTWSVRARQRMRRLDHSAIFVLIAGTYTPLALALGAVDQARMLTVAWAGATLGVARALFWVTAPKWLVAVLAVGMGWLAVLYTGPLRQVAGTAVVLWMAAGGVLYSVGALIYALKRPNPWPRVFGYHELFHLLVLAAAVTHYVAILGTLPFLVRG